MPLDRRPSVADHADFYRAEAARMRREAEKHAAAGEFERAGLALMIAQEAEDAFTRLTRNRWRL